RTRQCRGRVVLRCLEPTTPSLRATPPRRGGEKKEFPSCKGGAEATRPRRRGVVAGLKPHHPGTPRHPSSTRRGKCKNPPLLRRRGRVDAPAAPWGGCGPQNPTTPSLRATPPRRGGEKERSPLLRRRGRGDAAAAPWGGRG